jgi:BarA-like signal transduction histidine kinase
LATFFFAALFFFTATSTPWIVVRTSKTRVYRTRLPQAPQHLYDMWRN